jgi:hypothetical protein
MGSESNAERVRGASKVALVSGGSTVRFENESIFDKVVTRSDTLACAEA